MTSLRFGGTAGASGRERYDAGVRVTNDVVGAVERRPQLRSLRLVEAPVPIAISIRPLAPISVSVATQGKVPVPMTCSRCGNGGAADSMLTPAKNMKSCLRPSEGTSVARRIAVGANVN